MSTAQPVAGSFRDPLNQVFFDGTSVLRGYSTDGVDDLEALLASDFFTQSIDSGDIVATKKVETTALPGEWAAALWHERVPVISYPYEWSFGMLRDAALLQLNLTRRALDAKLMTKDATPYNVQFVGAQPTFIDVGSFERLRAGEPWPGYRQFCQLFLYPLLLRARLDVPFRPWLRGSTEGITPTEIANLLRWRDRWRPRAFTHVGLHARAERKYSDSERDVGNELKGAGFGPGLVAAQLNGLTKAVTKLQWKRSDSTWSSYSDRAHYGSDALDEKAQFVADVVGRTDRELVWDLGANDGQFSRIAAKNSRAVIAVDSDELVVDRLYRELSAEKNKIIVPMVMDLIDSSPSLGWRSNERIGFFQRSRPDVILALALVHHLALPGNVPIAQIVDWLAEPGAEVVLEVPHEDDPMVVRLLRAKRKGTFDHYTLANFDAEIRRAFRVERSLVLSSGTRTIYHLVPPTT